MDPSDALRDLLVRGLDDDIQAAEVASVVVRHFGAGTPEEIRDRSLRLIRELVGPGLMAIGDIVGSGVHPPRRTTSVRFQPWDLSFEEAMNRVEREWRRLERGPGPGEICWLITTQRGEEAARRLPGPDEPAR